MTEQRDENKLIAERRAKLNKLRSGSNTPFPNDFKPKALADQLEKTYSLATKQDLETLRHQTSVAGRVMRNRGSFIVIQDRSGAIQLYVTKHSRVFVKNLDLGDIIGVEGELFKTNVGEKTVLVKKFSILNKSLKPIPIPKTDPEGNVYDQFSDAQSRYRQRYIDLSLIHI